MSALSTGQFKVVVSIEKQDEFMERAQAIVNRASIVFLLSALAIALAIASNSMADSTLLSSIARILLFAILVAGAWLFFSVHMHDWRMNKNKRNS